MRAQIILAVYKIGNIRDTMSAQIVRVSNCAKAAVDAAFLPLYRTVADRQQVVVAGEMAVHDAELVLAVSKMDT